jgi:flagellar biosynthesis/type III secretory pathway chaperone
MLSKIQKTKYYSTAKKLLTNFFNYNFKRRNKVNVSVSTERGGKINHYFHFIIELLYPFLQLNLHKSQQVYIQNLKNFKNILDELSINHVDEAINLQERETITLQGLLPEYHTLNLNSFKRQVFHILEIKPVENPTQIVLIKRGLPADFEKHVDVYNHAKTGSLRRRITNNDQIYQYLSQILDPTFQLQQVELENMSFKDQCKLFDSAAFVIGLHGAGLTNAVWMQPQTCLIEIAAFNQYFESMCKQKGIMYWAHGEVPPIKDTEIAVEAEKLGQMIQSDPILKRFVKK